MWSSLLQLDLLILVSYWEEVEQPRGTSRYPKMCCTGQCLGAKTPLHVAWIHLGSMVYMLFPNVSQKKYLINLLCDLMAPTKIVLRREAQREDFD